MDPFSSSQFTRSALENTCEDTYGALFVRTPTIPACRNSIRDGSSHCKSPPHRRRVGQRSVCNRMNGEMWPHSQAYQVAVAVMNSPLLVFFAHTVQHQFSPLNGLTHRCRHTTATYQRLTEVSYNRMFCNSPSMTEPFMHSTAHAHHQQAVTFVIEYVQIGRQRVLVC
jgi:hypothetical protein